MKGGAFPGNGNPFTGVGTGFDRLFHHDNPVGQTSQKGGITMKECTSGINKAPGTSEKEEVLFDAQRFELRMSRWMKSVDELWDEYEKLKKYSLRQKE